MREMVEYVAGQLLGRTWRPESSENDREAVWWRFYTDRCRDPDGRELLNRANEHARFLKSVGARFIPFYHEEFPPQLREINPPVMGLNVIGECRFDQFAMFDAVVGSRKANPHALRESVALGRYLAMSGSAVISGGAFGCDFAAHHGVLGSGARPCPAIVVFANGFERLYPANNKQLFEEIKASGGMLVTERLWNARPKPYDFPIRNRIIAGLAQRVFLMQAAGKSGAMSTANYALDFGRDVHVLVHDPRDGGTDGGAALIFQGAFGFDRATNIEEKVFYRFGMHTGEGAGV